MFWNEAQGYCTPSTDKFQIQHMVSRRVIPGVLKLRFNNKNFSQTRIRRCAEGRQGSFFSARIQISADNSKKRKKCGNLNIGMQME